MVALDRGARVRGSVQLTGSPPKRDHQTESEPPDSLFDSISGLRLGKHWQSIAGHPSTQSRSAPGQRWMVRAITHAELREMLERLATEQRAVAELLYWDEMPLPEIADRLGWSLSYVCRQCISAIRALREELRILRSTAEDPEPFGEGLGVQGRRSRGVVWLELSGRLDNSTIPLLHQWLVQAERGADSEIVLDLEGLVAMDASGLVVLERARDRARRRAVPLVFVHAREPIRLVLEPTEEISSMEQAAQEVADTASPYAGAGWPPMLIPQTRDAENE